MSKRLRGWAPAKVNLILEVTGRRPDGYHEIDSILQTLDLAGTVDLVLDVNEPGVTVVGPFAAGVPADDTNLAWRAAAALAEACGRTTNGVHITLDKQVPPAGGLGGGASDAATVLRLLQPIWGQSLWGVSEETLLGCANAVGSDEAFFLTGGCARVRGRGDVVERVPSLPPRGVVLFVPPDTIERKTARMFDALSALPYDSGSVTAEFARIPPASFGSLDVFNSFERVAFDLFPWLAGLWQSLEGAVGAPVRLAGAGPTLFWIGEPVDASRVAVAAEDLPCTVIRTATAGSLWRR